MIQPRVPRNEENKQQQPPPVNAANVAPAAANAAPVAAAPIEQAEQRRM